MTRKRYKKLMMSIGFHKNAVNNYNPFTAWPFCVMPSICSYDYAWQLDKPIFECFNSLKNQVDAGVYFTYKGYTTCVRYDKRYSVFYGKLENIDEHVEFHTDKIMNIEDEFRLAVDDYLSACARVGKEPEVQQLYDY